MLNVVPTQAAQGADVLQVKGVRQGFQKGSGELLVLQTDFDNWVLKMGRGFRPGQTTTVAGREQVDPNVEIMRPSNCPSTVCLPD